MAGKKSSSKTTGSNGTGRKRDGRTTAGSALSQSPSHRPDGCPRREPTADELGRRAWETTYRNKHK